MKARTLAAAVGALVILAGPVHARLAPLPGTPGAEAPGARLIERALARRAAEDQAAWNRGAPRGGPLAPVMVEDGVLFRFREGGARRVSVVGDFNDWDEYADPLRRTREGLWRAVLDLDEGPWAYMYVVDGEWYRDPDNPVVHVDAEAATEDWEPEETSFLVIRHGEIVRPRPSGFHEGSLELTGSYDRVDRVSLWSTIGYENRVQLHPELSLGAGWSFGRQRGVYDVAVTQPLFFPRMVDIGVRAYRRTATPDAHRMADTENSLATFFFREDWRDYHEAEGVSAHATLYLGPVVELTARWKDEEHRSLSKTTDWGLFGGEKRMRRNPPADEGQLRTLLLSYDVDTRNSTLNPTRGVYALGSYEWAGGGLGGDFEFRRASADFRRYLKLSRGHFLDFRVSGALIDRARRGGPSGEITGFDAVPVQERLYLGGVGTMRATQFKSLTGDRMVLANAETRVEIFRNLQAAVFVDVGDAWIGGVSELDVKTDAGIGLQDSDSSFRVNIAKKIDGRQDGDGVFVSARIRRMF